MMLPEAWEIDYVERSRRVHEMLEREFLEIPLGPCRPPDVEYVPGIGELEREKERRNGQ